MLIALTIDSVMAGIVPAIPLMDAHRQPKRDPRDKPGDDGRIPGRLLP
jgi:hypothetical protein